MRNEFTAIIEGDETTGFWAYCPEVPGANGQGATLDEVRADLAAAIELMLELRREEGLRDASPGARRDRVVVVG
jgi:predicted RNase H-like HicB family nuclease